MQKNAGFYALLTLLYLSLWHLMLAAPYNNNHGCPLAIYLLIALVAEEHEKQIAAIHREESAKVQQYL